METGKPWVRRDEGAALRSDERRARRMVRTWGTTSADADDITQEVLIVLAARREAFCAPPGANEAEAWSAFVWGVVVRQVARFRRERGRQRRADQCAEPPAPSVPSLEDVMIAEAPRALFRRAVAALASPLGAVMELHLLDLSMPAAAARLEIPAGTAWTRFRAARDEVHAMVRRWQAEEGGMRWS
jgi:DNA-directed RNA polymerase specialized sigma24 family protein